MAGRTPHGSSRLPQTWANITSRWTSSRSPGLHSVFEVDEFLPTDLRSITVDASVYEGRPARYRFTLAHELAHALLHRRIYREHRFRTIEEFTRFQEDLDEEDRGWLEWQAYALAGLILVPAELLRQGFQRAVRRASQAGLSVRRLGEVALAYIAADLGKRFGVSAEVIEKRLRKDRLWPERATAGPER